MPGTTHRPATSTDLPAVIELTRRFEQHWFGAVESSDVEVEVELGHVDHLETDSRLVIADGRPVGFAGVWGEREATLRVDPAGPVPDVLAVLVPWLDSRGTHTVDVLCQDRLAGEALSADGWLEKVHAFDLIREPPTAAAPLPDPVWPADVTVTGLSAQVDAQAVHHLVYVAAGWAQITGHVERDPAGWWALMTAYPGYDAEQQVVVSRRGRPVGVALGRVYADGTGWINQLAVDRAERGTGLGRALLLEAMHRRLRAGASSLGLSVYAGNATALGLYESVGLRVDREWVSYEPAAVQRQRLAAQG